MGVDDLGVGYHAGNVREMNQDSLVVLIPQAGEYGVLLVVADGMGGHKGGQVASSRVVMEMAAWFQAADVALWLRALDNAQRPIAVGEALRHNLESLNQEIYARAQTGEELSNMGTTATVAYLYQSLLVIAHVGDTAAYRLRQGQLQPLTQDHSWVAEQMRAGYISPEEAYHHPQRNRLLRALGINPYVQVDIYHYDVQPSDQLLLCSDGVTTYFDPPVLHQWWLKHSALSSQAVADSFVTGACEQGGGDNICVVTVRVTPNGPHNPNLWGTHTILREVTPHFESEFETVTLPPPTSVPGSSRGGDTVSTPTQRIGSRRQRRWIRFMLLAGTSLIFLFVALSDITKENSLLFILLIITALLLAVLAVLVVVAGGRVHNTRARMPEPPSNLPSERIEP